MKKKHLIGAAVLSLALFASCTMPVISTRERVLASSQQDQEIEFTIKKLSPAGYSTVKGVLAEATANYLKVSENKKKYQYCWVEDENNLPNDDAWKALPALGREGDDTTSSNNFFMSFEGAEPNQYLVIKKASGNNNIVFKSNAKYGRENYSYTPQVLFIKNKHQISLGADGEGTYEYRQKQEAESGEDSYDKETWKQADNLLVTVDTPSENETVFYYVRKKAQDNNLASEPKIVKIVNRAADKKIDFETLKNSDKLSFQLQDDGVLISGLESLQGKESELTYVRETSKGEVNGSSTSIPYGTDKNTFLLPNQDRVVIKSDGITILTFAFRKMQYENGEESRIKQENKDKKIIGLNANTSYEYKKEGDSAYKDVNSGNTTLEVPDYGTYYIRIKGNDKNITINHSDININLPSEDLKVKVEKPLPPLIYYPDLFEPQINGEEAKKAEETKKEEEAKKAEETKKEEEAKKAEEAKQAEEAKKTEEAKQTEEMKKPVLQNVQAKKKTGATISSEKIEAVLNADSGKLTVTTKNAEVSLSKEVLDAVFGFEAEPLKVSVKTEALKKDSKEEKMLSKNKNHLASKNIYHLSVKVGKDSLNDYDLQGGKLVVTLKTSLKTAPKKLYAMNLATGKKGKASFKAGKVRFTSDIEGKFVLVTK